MGNITANQENMFKIMLQLDTIRGPHSTGVLYSTSTGNTNYLKCMGTPWEMFQDKRFDQIFHKKLTSLIGHNRWATEGGINLRNAHPFEHGDTIGVHNGTIRNWRRDLGDSGEYNVDSDCLYHNIEKHGIHEAVKQVKDGAFALAWNDLKDNKVKFCRNSDRPLNFAYSKNGESLFFASEPWMIYVAADRAKVELDGDVRTVATETLYSIDLDTVGFGKKINLERDVTLKYYEPPKIIPKKKDNKGDNLLGQTRTFIVQEVQERKPGGLEVQGYLSSSPWTDIKVFITQFNKGPFDIEKALPNDEFQGELCYYNSGSDYYTIRANTTKKVDDFDDPKMIPLLTH